MFIYGIFGSFLTSPVTFNTQNKPNTPSSSNVVVPALVLTHSIISEYVYFCGFVFC